MNFTTVRQVPIPGMGLMPGMILICHEESGMQNNRRHETEGCTDPAKEIKAAIKKDELDQFIKNKRHVGDKYDRYDWDKRQEKGDKDDTWQPR
ncbi:hypothetical protein ACH5RR_033958 [Cinchona calisaya]|uniref:Uncharacterized protein n=1 Tax=Cinchona calisaya TaxID=153742 RepID=A0ABD2Y9H5_9GENT